MSADPTTAGGGTEGLRTPPPIPVRGRFFLTACPACGWVGSSEQCGTDSGDDSDVYCPACGEGGCDEEPIEGEAELHSEAVMQRILAAEAALARASAQQARVEAERDEREAWAAAWHRVVETTLILMDLSPALGGDEAAPAIQTALAKLAADRDRLKAALAFYADPDDWSGAPWRLTFQSPSRDGNGWDVARSALNPPEAPDAP